MNGAMNRKLLFVLGPVTGVVMFAAVVMIATFLTNRGVQGALPRSGRDRRRHAPRGGTGDRGGRRGGDGAGKALRGGRIPDLSRGREPRGHLVGRAAPPAVRGLRPGRSALRLHHRGDRLQDRRPAIRPARARVHEAPLGVLLAHGDLRGVPDVHAHRSVSEVHELPDERVLPHVSPVRAALLRRGRVPLHLLLRLGEVPSTRSSWPGARPQRRGHGDHVHRQCLAHVHDVAERGFGYRSRDLRLGRGLQLHLDADQHPSSHRERRLRRIGRRRVRGLQVPAGRNRRGARALRLDGIHRQLRRHHRLPAASRSPATGSRARSTRTRRRSGSR